MMTRHLTSCRGMLDGCLDIPLIEDSSANSFLRELVSRVCLKWGLLTLR